MSLWRELARGLRGLINRPAADRDIADEVEQYVDDAAASFEARGLSPEERRQVFFEGRSWPLSLVDTLHVGGEGEEVEGGLRAPMPGKVIAVSCSRVPRSRRERLCW